MASSRDGKEMDTRGVEGKERPIGEERMMRERMERGEREGDSGASWLEMMG